MSAGERPVGPRSGIVPRVERALSRLERLGDLWQRSDPERAQTVRAQAAHACAHGAHGAHAAGTCRVCDALGRYAGVPAVASALARLVDELSVAEMLATSPPEVLPQLGRLADWRRARSHRIEPWRVVLESLAHGPLPMTLIDEDLHGPPLHDRRRMRDRQQAARNVVRRLVLKRLVVRVGWSVYALPGVTAGMVDRTIEDARRFLIEAGSGHAGEAHALGYTTLEIADKCDVSPNTVRNWLTAMRRAGDRVVVTHAERAGRHGSGFSRYRIDPVDRRGSVQSMARRAGDARTESARQGVRGEQALVAAG